MYFVFQQPQKPLSILLASSCILLALSSRSLASLLFSCASLERMSACCWSCLARSLAAVTSTLRAASWVASCPTSASTWCLCRLSSALRRTVEDVWFQLSIRTSVFQLLWSSWSGSQHRHWAERTQTPELGLAPGILLYAWFQSELKRWVT